MEYFAPEIVGKTRRKTPDGFLICLGVPIARIGRMVYNKKDLPRYEAGPDGIIYVDRFAEELFRPETIASIEGMPVVDDHPPGVMMTPETFKMYACGHGQNVRQGEGEFEDCLLADLFFMDKGIIKKIEDDDKVQISLGYDAKYKMIEPGHYEQYNIVGNHNALVWSGRCGPRCAVGDSATVTDHAACQCQGKSDDSKRKKSMKPSLKTALQATAVSLGEAIKTLDDGANVENDGGVHVHLHGELPLNGTGTLVGDKRTKDAVVALTGDKPDNREGDTKVTQMLDSIMGRLDAMEDSMADFTGDRRMRDAKAKRMRDTKGETEEQRIAREKEEDAARDARMRDARVRDADETEAEKEAREKREAAQAATDARMKDGEATEAELKEAEKTKDAAHNSSGLEAEFTKTLELIQIIAPGMGTPTFDSNTHFATTAKSLCTMRRNALKNALARDDVKVLITPLVDSVATLDSLPCSAVRVAFYGVGEAFRQRNNRFVGRALSSFAAPATAKGVKSPAELNAINAKRWGRGA
jgi:hypothetical protein